MTASKRKGTRWETDLRDYFRTNGWPECERLPSEGARDRGDLAGLPWTIEAKATLADLGEALKEAEKEAANAGKPAFAVAMRRKRYPVAEGYAVLPIWLLAQCMREDA